MLRETLAGDGGKYIERLEIRFKADLEAGVIRYAWQQTVAATEALRARFVFENDDPVGWTADGDPGECLELHGAADDIGQAPDPSKGAPWKVLFFPDERRWVWIFHHALLDGRSIVRIARAFIDRVHGLDPGPLPLAAWQAGDDAMLAEASRFLTAHEIEDIPASPEFPGDKREAAKAVEVLGAETARGLETFASRCGVTAATLVTWAWGQALATAMGADAARVLQVRSGPRLDGLAGFTMNTLPLLIDRTCSGSVREALASLRRRLEEMRRFETVAAADLTAPGRGTCGVLMVDRAMVPESIGTAERVESIDFEESGGGGLLAAAWVHPDLRIELDSDGSLLGPAAVGAIIGHWSAILRRLAVLETDDAGEITKLADAQIGFLGGIGDGGPAVVDDGLTSLWDLTVEKHADAIAVEAGGDRLTYRGLEQRASGLARALVEQGVAPGDTVASLLEDRFHLPVVMLAAAKAGAVHVPLEPALPALRRDAITIDFGARLLITDFASAGGWAGKILAPDTAGGIGTMLPAASGAEELLALLYTSGSTGAPKGVMLHHGGIVNEAVAMSRVLELGPGDRVLQFASPGFDAALEEVFATLLSGATLLPRPDEVAGNLDAFHGFLTDQRVTVVDLTTAFWAAWCAWMAEEGKSIPADLRAVVIGGERLSMAALADWRAAGGAAIPLVNSYGPTEASVVATVEILRGADLDRDPPIGRPLPGVMVRVADARGRLLPPGAAGELWIGGPCVSPGYWGTQAPGDGRFLMIDGVRHYRSGDRVHLDVAGRLMFLGRLDQQLKIRGQRVEPGEVVREIESFPGVGGCHVGPLDGALAAWVRWTSGPPEAWPAALAAQLARSLPAAAIPTRWAAVESFPLTERGKTDIRALPLPTLHASAGAGREAPATEGERRIAAIWCDLLGLDRVGRDESFFALGGNSLAALRMFAMIAREWQVRIPMATLLQAATPRLLAAHLEQTGSGTTRHDEPVVAVIRDEGDLEPLFCIHGGDGGVIFYRNLTDHFPARRPLLAIEAPSLAGDAEVVVPVVEESAAEYLRVLRRKQPKGPYHLAGYSYGGLLVYEMARLLVEAGEEVGFVGLLDTVNPATPLREYRLMERIEVYWKSQSQSSFPRRVWSLVKRFFAGVSTHLRVKREIHTARTAGNTEPHSEIRMLQVREAHWQAMERHRPQYLDCHVTLFRTATDDKFEIPGDYGWREMVRSLEIVIVPGDHLTMFDAEHAPGLAREIANRA